MPGNTWIQMEKLRLKQGASMRPQRNAGEYPDCDIEIDMTVGLQ